MSSPRVMRRGAVSLSNAMSCTHTRATAHTLRAPPSTILCSHSTPLPESHTTASQSALPLFGSPVTLLQQLSHTTLSQTTPRTLTLTASHSALTLRTSQDLLAQVKTCWAHLMVPRGNNKKNAEMSSPTRLPTLSTAHSAALLIFPSLVRSHITLAHTVFSPCLPFFCGASGFCSNRRLSRHFFPPLPSASTALTLCCVCMFPLSRSPERPICSIAWRPDGQQARLENKHENRVCIVTCGGNGVRPVGKRGCVGEWNSVVSCRSRRAMRTARLLSSMWRLGKGCSTRQQHSPHRDTVCRSRR